MHLVTRQQAVVVHWLLKCLGAIVWTLSKTTVKQYEERQEGTIDAEVAIKGVDVNEVG
jgi:hypothetical protein